MPERTPYLRPSWNKPLRAAGLDPEDERKRFYNSARWRRTRLAFLNENPVCARCLEEGNVVEATTAHHRVERLADPEKALDPENLEALCGSCHSRHHKGKKGD